MEEIQKEKLQKIFIKYENLKLVYFFGSRARGDANSTSDYDFAIYIDSRDSQEIFDTKVKLLADLGELLRSDDIDIVVLDTAEQPELKYKIIQEGQLIYEKEPYKVIVEPKILNEYFDFYAMLKRNGLTKA